MSGSQCSNQALAGALGLSEEQGLKFGGSQGPLVGLAGFWAPLGQCLGPSSLALPFERPLGALLVGGCLGWAVHPWRSVNFGRESPALNLASS